MEREVNNLADMQAAATTFVAEIVNMKPTKAVVVALYGDLGSGKTTFTQGVARALGLDQTIISPTFVIERVYKIDQADFTHFIHIDCYRLDSSTELARLGWEEISTNPRNIIFIEWAERVEDILPNDVIKIEFEYVGENKRKVTFL